MTVLDHPWAVPAVRPVIPEEETNPEAGAAYRAVRRASRSGDGGGGQASSFRQFGY
ncbi:hypothetical protein HEK616_02680 [Streptomyces nigrescens]|uniref:Uncharacterized protein n=1 Tax=Streptomyces nigrescens TaxID=1920 RepID=A0ABM7ZK56_STRNI|nr:hypothetical protein HEK616_02680 [Streptomyces nigrescens]